MRILCDGFRWFDAAAPEFEAEHEIVRVQREDIRRAWERPQPDWFRELAPDGWEPDVALFTCPEYHVLPPAVAELPCPVALWVGDWYLNPNSVLGIARFTDLVLADAVGASALRRAGLDHVDECCPWTFDPRLHRPDWSAPPLYDVSFVGNLNDEVQRERARWLERVALLSERYRVAVLTDVWGEKYVEVLQRSRISFNWSITGDVNMRCFEATACGSMLMLERDNAHVRHWFEEGEECVLYGDDDFEAVVERYLAHEDERRRIALAGWRRVQGHAPAPRLRGLLGRLEELAAAGRRRARASDATGRCKAFAFQALNLVVDEPPFGGVELLLEEAERARPRDPAVLANRGVLYLLCARGQARSDLTQAGADYLAAAIGADPSDAVARLNLANLLALVGRSDEAAHTYRALLDELDERRCTARPDRLLYPGDISDFVVAWAWASIGAAPAPELALTALVASQAAERLGDLTALPATRIALYRRALAAWSGAASARAKLAELLLTAGDGAGAAEEYRQSVEEKPLRPLLWDGLLRALAAAGDEDARTAFLSERLRLAARIGPLRPFLDRADAYAAATPFGGG